jgi:Spy/CpxP family protein refolding chaperone
MNRLKLAYSFLLICGLLAMHGTNVHAQARQEPLNEIMIPPFLLFEHADEIGLDATQKEFVESKVKDMQEKFPDLQKGLQQEVQALSELLHQEHPDAQKAEAQLDKVLDREREIKKAQLSLALAIQEKLTPDQLKKARELKAKMVAEQRSRGPSQPMPESLRNKLEQVRELARKMHEDGKDVSDVKAQMDRVGPLLRESKFREAEETIDTAIKSLQDQAKK